MSSGPEPMDKEAGKGPVAATPTGGRGRPVKPKIKRRGGGLPVIWLVPIVALAIAGWLAYTTLQEKGPVITVTFRSAEGLEAGKTQVRYKDVAMGLVNRVRLNADLRSIEAEIEMQKEAEPFLRSGTRFWIVRPRLGFSGVSGLGTLVSGGYVAVDPAVGDGARLIHFTGLEEPPPISSDAPGRSFRLRAGELGSLAPGLPVTYQGLTVGQVLEAELAADRRTFEVAIFVNAPHDSLVRDGSRFWNASGIDLSLGASGVELNISSLQSVILGGIAFDTPGIEGDGKPAEPQREFTLFGSRRQVDALVITERIPYLVEFEGSVRGLRRGSPVEFRGLQVGEVTDVRLQFEPKLNRVVVPVTLVIEPQRIGVEAGQQRPNEPYRVMKDLVASGLRAQLRPGNLITGELVVDLGFHPEAGQAELESRQDGPPLIPSVPADLEEITRSVSEVLREVASADIGGLVKDLQRSVEGISKIVNSPDIAGILGDVRRATAELSGLTQALDQEVRPVANSLRDVADASARTVRTADATLTALNGFVGRDSKIRIDLSEAIQELSRAARSIRTFADYLERNPDSLLRGRPTR